MSIVAERPVRMQDAAPVSAGLAEEVERQEREDNARGPEPEGRVADRRLSRGYTTGARVDLRTREDVPLEAGDRERLERLFRLHNARLVRYLAARVGWTRWALAEDLAQEMWRDLACRPLDMAGWRSSEEESFPLLALRARRQISWYFRLRMNEREQLLGSAGADDDRTLEARLDALAEPGPDATVCAVADLMDGEDADWRGCWAQAIELLPARQREVLELSCREGMTVRSIAARLGLTYQTVSLTLSRALGTLRDPEAIAALREQRDRDRLPDGWERVLDRLPAVQAAVVRLRVKGLSNAEAARQLGRNQATTHTAYRRAAANLRLMVQERRMDPVQAAPAKATTRCARVCASGCYLRTVAS
ncbi:MULTISPECIES: sigma-70 family RNA polymerase sigma factor [unclassified Streptomyces]|uniref:sigma-70 family RNA polymerase sigma factor n=1 Tax=unclassified Streptomyces TaxID=2593676 RepID=UPI000515F620|nr:MULTISPECIES: sigma-70 family RNA polymerase sigma factor [unclassified Streptomyces]